MFRSSDAMIRQQGTSTNRTLPYHSDMNTASTPSQWETPVTFPMTSPEAEVTTCVDVLVGSSAIESPAIVYV